MRDGFYAHCHTNNAQNSEAKALQLLFSLYLSRQHPSLVEGSVVLFIYASWNTSELARLSA